MHKLYKTTREKIERLKASVAMAYRQEKDGEIGGQKHHFFLLNLKLVGLEFIFNLIKLLIIFTHDSGTVFKIFYQTSDFEPCLFPYRTFKVIHKKIRMFSCAVMIIALTATLITKLAGF